MGSPSVHSRRRLPGDRLAPSRRLNDPDGLLSGVEVRAIGVRSGGLVTSGYDVIGDVHGYAVPLERLLGDMGYVEVNGAYRHSERQAIFIGDLIDRGPDQLRVLEIARSMVEAGSALIVMGNHEFNAIAWATRDDYGEWCRPHSAKNRGQHEVFLAAVGEDSSAHREWINWFLQIPMWLELDGLRIVHACWHTQSIEFLGESRLSREAVVAPENSALYDAVEVILKGPEIDLGGFSYADKDGVCRHKARLRWWDPTATTLSTAAEIPAGATACGGAPFGPLPDTPLERDSFPTSALDLPVLYGHYWRHGSEPRIDNGRAACLDWSVAKGGPLVAYRFSGESELTNEHLVSSG